MVVELEGVVLLDVVVEGTHGAVEVVVVGTVVVVVPGRVVDVVVAPPLTVVLVVLVVEELVVVHAGRVVLVVEVLVVVVVVGSPVPFRYRWKVCETCPPLPITTNLKATVSCWLWVAFQMWMVWVSEVVHALGLWLHSGWGETCPETICSWHF